MLICPQCQFENPNTNKYCQRCGTSLTQKVCPKCGSNVARNAISCSNCGTETGTFWWAIVTPLTPGTPVNGATSQEDIPEVQVELALNEQSSPLQSEKAYLDAQQRYQLLEPLPPLSTEVEVRVLDCQPLQLSLLKSQLLAGSESLMGMTIPAIAKAYLALQSQFPQTDTAIHDAWQQEDRQVVLIEDRSGWQPLIEAWRDEETTSSQILPWLYKMTQYWVLLEPWQCRQSLLEVSNLRLSQQALVLQRLSAEPIESLTVQDLSRVWQELFHASQRTLFGPLVRLLEDLKADNIHTIDDLQLRLEAIADELQIIITAKPISEKTSLVTDSDPRTTLTLDKPRRPMQSDDMSTVVLPMQLFSLEDVGCTDVGSQRNHNEDCFGIETKLTKEETPRGRTVKARGIYILCDGMGGHAAGEVASALAVKTLQEYFQTNWHQDLPDEATLRNAVLSANQAIYNANQQDTRSGTGRMGTTLVLVLIQDTKIAVAHVGDSRLYRLSRRQGLEQITVDHEVGQREISRGVEPAIAYARPDAYQLTQALGPRDDNLIKPDIKFMELNEDVLLVLASDGLCDNDLLEQKWQTHLKPLLNCNTGLEQGARNLIDLANQYNGHDNITAVLVRATVRPDMQQHQEE